jgi:hypothetical protein
MPRFPRLKTSALAQYPATRSVRFQNQVLRFVDGGEQRYRDCAGALRRWEIRLSRLDEGELAALETFFCANRGALGSFEFTDPWDEQVYPDCSLENDELELAGLAEMNGAVSLSIVQNRGDGC